jgi:phosphate transport system protein
MPEAFVGQLAELEKDILARLDVAANTLATVAGAIRSPSRQRIAVLADDAVRLRAQTSATHGELITTTSRETPVASDLRLVLALIDLADHTVLIANQFDLISQQLADLDPTTMDRANRVDTLVRMSELGSAQLRKSVAAFRHRDLASARELDIDDDELDQLNREICGSAISLGDGEQERELGFHYVLIARSLERIGDNAVDIAEQADFILTGQMTEFTDASKPRTRLRHREPPRDTSG